MNPDWKTEDHAKDHGWHDGYEPTYDMEWAAAYWAWNQAADRIEELEKCEVRERKYYGNHHLQFNRMEDRIEELEAALRKSAVQHNDFDDGSGGCIARALGDDE